MLGSFEIMGVPKELCLLCRPNRVHLLANFTLSRQSNHPPTHSQGTIRVSISSETPNIAAALRFQGCPCHLMATLRLIDPRRIRRMCHSVGRRRNSVQRNVFCLVSMVRVPCRRARLFILNEHLFLHARLYDNPSWIFPALRAFPRG